MDEPKVETIRIGVDWMDRLLPAGFPIRTSTVITGPGGSGKPLIGETIVSAWLREGGSVVFMSLQYPSRDFLLTSLRNVAGIDLSLYKGRVAFIQLDATIDAMEDVDAEGFRANLVKPDVWDAALERACRMVPDAGPGVLVFGSALNLLLFSPTYGEAILERMRRTVAEDKTRTYLFSASTTAKREEIAVLEEAADNLIMSHSKKDPFRLYMRILRMKGVPFVSEEIEVPFPPAMLEEIKDVAEHSRRRVIPLISKI